MNFSHDFTLLLNQSTSYLLIYFSLIQRQLQNMLLHSWKPKVTPLLPVKFQWKKRKGNLLECTSDLREYVKYTVTMY